MDRDTPRGMIQGLLKISEKSIDDDETEKRVPTVQQTPSTSLPLASLRTLRSTSRSAESVTRSSGFKRSAQRSLLKTGKRSKSEDFPTPSETITPRTTIQTFLKAANTGTPIEMTIKQPDEPPSENLLQKHSVQPTSSVRNVVQLLGSSANRSASSRRSSGRNLTIATPRETITPRENIKTFLRAAETEVPTKTQTKPINEKGLTLQPEHSKDESPSLDGLRLSSVAQDEPEAFEASTDDLRAVESAEALDEAEVAVPSQHEVAYEVSDVSHKNHSTRDSVGWSKLQTPVLPDMAIAKASPVVLTKPPSSSQHRETSRKAKNVKAKRSQVKSTKKNARLPLSLVKGIFTHFSALKVSKDAFDVIENGSDAFFQHLSSDLVSYCKHAKRKTIEQADVELLMRRQGLVSSRESFHALIEKYLPMEYRQEIIPSAKAGNKVFPKPK